MKIQVNGKVASEISVLDRGLFYGDGLFETMRVNHGQIFLLEDHLERLKKSCARLYMSLPDLEKISDEISSFIQGEQDGVLKLIYTRGAGGRAYRLPEKESANHILILNDYHVPISSDYENGIDLTVCNSRLSRNPQLAGVKHLNKLEYVLAAKELMNTQYQQALLLDTNGNIIEGLTMNVFFVVKNILYTPDLTYAGVEGIMRNRLLDQAKTIGIDYRIDEFTMLILDSVDEIFLSNSVVGILPVKQITTKKFRIGEVTRQLQKFSNAIMGYN